MITLSEESRRMQDMMKMYAMPGMDMSAFGGDGETLILNVNHPLVQFVVANRESENTGLICEQLYDLAKLQHAQHHLPSISLLSSLCPTESPQQPCRNSRQP